jgi:glyoxylase-like metal-dependent hydrolase (beta-lactamase superfamily II)
MTLARRGFVTGIAGSAMLAAMPQGGIDTASAAAPPGAAQAPGFFRFKVGDLEVIQISDGLARRPLDAGFVRNAELPAVQQALADAFQPTDTVTIPFTTTVINTGSRLVMIDAGTGGMAAPTAGTWLANFRAAGYAPEQVDAIIVSHFHGDHIQGIRDKEGKAVFPNASLHVPEAEWAFWMDDGQMSRAPEGMKGAFGGVRRVFVPAAKDVVRYEGGQELLPGITTIAAHGHTPGHTAFIVTSGDGRLLVWSDTTNKPELFVRNPTWQAVFDMNGEEAAATRARLLDMAATERMPMVGYHFPFPAAGFIARDGAGRYQFVPRFWEPI